MPRVVRGAPAGAVYELYGDEFGKIRFAGRGGKLKLGAKIEMAAPHCDPTINMHDFYHCVRGNVLVDIWPVDARGSL
jgi:D-serine deaminase-like pyridoxal phosphate-dependent protein